MKISDNLYAHAITHPVSGCWLWKRAKTPPGYGSLSVKGVRKYAHRFSWEISVGAIPLDMHVLHHCDNPSCINPAHLFLGSNLDNIKDKLSKNRQRNGVSRGEKHGMCRIDESKVSEIRGLLAEGIYQKDIGARFGVSQSLVSAIATGRLWRQSPGVRQ